MSDTYTGPDPASVPRRNLTVVITGATGFIGAPIARALAARGDRVIALVRDVEKARAKLESPKIELVQVETLESQGPWCDSLAGANAVLHLAGEPVAGKKWDAQQKQVIRDSRVESTRTIVESIEKLAPGARPRALVNASGIDYYPFAYDETDFDDDEVTESDKPGDTFLARVCRDWETEALRAEALGVRVVCLRTGLVLGKGGGAFPELARPFKLFAGGPIGSGRQWMSWIALADVVAIYISAIEDERYRGPINMVTASIRNRDFAKELGRAMHRPSWIPVPKFAVRVAAGSEFSESVLKGRRVMPTKLRELGYVWQYPTLDRALAAAL
ncbi:MAG TPA: TIGR01777 family oxidoreductase [Kofleriaceae bacterium]|nr:TIGR01777 family oxidoreductase [Kofleriaceae bacterium]